jgi:hypothetical protein
MKLRLETAFGVSSLILESALLPCCVTSCPVQTDVNALWMQHFVFQIRTFEYWQGRADPRIGKHTIPEPRLY